MAKKLSNSELRELNEVYEALQEGIGYAKKGELKKAKEVFGRVAPAAERLLDQPDIRTAYECLRSAVDEKSPLAALVEETKSMGEYKVAKALKDEDVDSLVDDMIKDLDDEKAGGKKKKNYYDYK